MSAKEEPGLNSHPEDPELESTDGGWDPYVASLLAGHARATERRVREQAGEPVRSFSRTEEKRRR
jgi:hypothetical protein